MNKHTILSFLVATILIAGSCNNNENKTAGTPAAVTDTSTNSNRLFTLLSPDSTHVDFNNVLDEGLNTNVLLYEYFYNGGGVAVGDINNDGLQDLYFSSNLGNNKLYLNKGHMQFQDITAASNVAVRPGHGKPALQWRM